MQDCAFSPSKLVKSIHVCVMSLCVSNESVTYLCNGSKNLVHNTGVLDVYIF